MAKRVHQHPNLIFSVGTQVVTLRDVVGQNGRTLHPRGSVGVVVTSPRDLEHSYHVRFLDGYEEALKPSALTLLAKYKEGEIGDSEITAGRSNLIERVIFQCVIGLRAYGLLNANGRACRTRPFTSAMPAAKKSSFPWTWYPAADRFPLSPRTSRRTDSSEAASRRRRHP